MQRRKFPSPEFWPGAEQLTYYLLLPALLFSAIISAQVDLASYLGLVIPYMAPFLFMGLILLLFRKRLGQDYPAFTSIFQGAIRFNSYVGFSIALAVFGQEGLARAAMFIALVIPLVNVMTVLVLSGGGQPGGIRILRSLVRNPLIIACVSALFLKALEVKVLSVLIEFLSILGRASLPLGLMVVGAALCFRKPAEDLLPIMIAGGSRLILMPLLMFASCHALGVTGLAHSIAVLFAALPGSPAAYVLARQMGGDHRLMANLTTVQILVSFVTLPIVLALEGYFAS
ncbi:MAG: AEC family transporter [Proteobacteria bacterium]|nr:AEC family transporter [Pseudomonadota bacterium]MBU1688843.1 AEC family transporter [Pseudomonadota bacterium]